MKFSNRELGDLAKGWALTSLAFAILLNGGLGSDLLEALIISSITVGVGFVFHEMAHKYFANRYGCKAEFRSFDVMLMISVVMAFLGFIIAAPGAVFIQGRINMARNGRISAAGPLVNILFSLGFLGILILFDLNGLLEKIAFYGFSINGWLALFNLLPFWNLDGTKVFAWDKNIYLSMISAAGLLVLLRFVLI